MIASNKRPKTIAIFASPGVRFFFLLGAIVFSAACIRYTPPRTTYTGSPTPLTFDVSYCDAIASPESYHGKQVLVSGRIYKGFESSSFRSPECPDDASAAIITSENQDVWRRLAQFDPEMQRNGTAFFYAKIRAEFINRPLAVNSTLKSRFRLEILEIIELKQVRPDS